MKRPHYRDIAASAVEFTKAGKRLPTGIFALFVGIIIKITLDQNDRGSLVAGSACEVTQRSDQICELAGSRSLGCHAALEIGILLADAFGNGLSQLITGKMFEIIVGQIFELEFIGGPDETVGKEGGDYRVCQLPDFSLGIFKGAVAVNHDFDMLAVFIHNLLLDIQD